MSIKIYNGYKLPPMSFAKLSTLIGKMESEMTKLFHILIKKRIAEEYAEAFDKIHFGKMPVDIYCDKFEKHETFTKEQKVRRCNERTIYSRIEDHTSASFERIYKTQHRDPDYDFQFSVSFISSNNKILVFVNTEKQVYLDLFVSITKAKEYGYWNNTDKPKGVSAKEWKERERDWRKGTDDFGRISTYGLQWELLDTRHLFLFWLKSEMILEYIPSNEQRATRIAKDRFYDVFCKRYRARNNITEIKNISDSGIFKAVDFLQTEKGKTLLKRMSEKIEKKLVPIGLAELEMTYNQVRKLKKYNHE